MAKRIVIINGPNLNLLGKREPEIYGHQTFDDFAITLKKEFPEHNIQIFQSNVEGEIINLLHNEGFKADGIIINAGGYTHTSVAIADAIAAIPSPVVEVHISNIHSREEYRHKSLLAANCKGVITGFGLNSYRLALLALLNS
ncbi:MAG: type II 3-dehydroquinate dehydratase [Bacteroidota bacterium]|nr:MAG: type II 3-dehydroquinate dehydratase [Bacteroidota bacterium]